jgi:beta-glucuronidase
MTVEDPFAHLHDEAYADRYATPRADRRTLVATLGRRADPLPGPWRLTLDPFEEGLRQAWYAFDDTPPETWATPRDWDPTGGTPVPVPSCWNLLKPEWTHYEGAVWYETVFDWDPAMPGERTVLQFGAANYLARVFLDGRLLGVHAGGSTPFSVEITDVVRPGPNRLLVMVENRGRPDRVPMHHIDWFNYGGLHRAVSLLRLPPIFVRDFGVALVPDGTFGRIRIDVTLSDAVDCTARFTCDGLGLDVAVPLTEGRGEATVAARPTLWSPDAPHLYDVALSMGPDAVTDRVGFREIRTAGTEILLNGRALQLRGVCVHEDDVATGRTTSPDDVERRFRHLKELNGNFLRLSHYPHDEIVGRMADRDGVLLWAEIPVYWAIDFANPTTFADAQNQMLELVARDRNRASVILWGVGNENADTDARLAFMAGLAHATRAADPTRLIGAACLINRETFRIEDRLAAHLDVIGLNEYFGWYEPDLEGLRRLIANSTPEKPVLVSETGADGVVGLRGEGRTLFSEDWQAEFYRLQAAALAQAPWIRGIAAWLLYDFRSERRQTGLQRGFNRKGLIAEDKTTKKRAFHALAALYADMAARSDR